MDTKQNIRKYDETQPYATEQGLMEGLRNGHNEAYRFLYQQHFVVLCEVAYQYLHDTFMAQSVTNDVIFHLWEIRQNLHITTTLRRYLIGAVRNRCLDLLKQEQTQKEIPLSAFDREKISEQFSSAYPSEDYPLGQLLENELEQELREAIHRLPLECRRVFLKSRIEGKKYQEISDELHISVPTVKYHIKKALTTLAHELERYMHIFF